MAIFSNPDAFKEHKQYVPLLKKALLLVKSGAEKKFLYFKQYPPFGGKKPPLVLVDYDTNCTTILTKAGHKPTAEGIVTLTAADELNFEVKKGALKRISLKKYFSTMGSGIKNVFVPAGEVDDEAEVQVPGVGSSVPAEGQVPPPPGESPAPPASAAPPPMDKRMEQKLAFEETEFKRRQLLARIAEMSAAPCPPSHEALKNEALGKAEAFAKENRFAEGQQQLDELAAKLKTLAARPAPPSTPPPPPAGATEAVPPAMDKRMEQKLEFEENEFKRRELAKRIEELQRQTVPVPMDAGKKQALEKAKALGEANKFSGANNTLDQFASALKAFMSKPPSQPPPAPPEAEVPKARKLSTYLGLNTEWDKARKTAAAELQRLERTIAAACDGEPVKDLVFKKLPQLHTLVLKLDARLSDALSAGAKATDPDKQLDLDKATRKLVGEYQGALRNHPLAAVVDDNPFGSFQVMQTLEAALAKIEAEFN